MDFCRTTPEMMCYNADYDCQAMMKYLPQAIRARISTLGESQYGLWKIRYISKKFMRVWFDDHPVLIVYDMAQFYNCSLAVAARRLGVKNKGSIPKAWYRAMAARLADPRTRARVLSYALDDALVLQQIIDKTVAAFALAGIKFERPFSNAVFAERYFRDRFKYRRNFPAEKLAQRAYHGGMIECLKVGYFPKAYYYDIHSAYPSAIATLVKPDGTWLTESYVRDDSVYALVDCDLSIPADTYKAPIPLRLRAGTIAYPTGKFRKVITLTEYRLCERRGWVVKVHKAANHIRASGHLPFEEVNAIYLKRAEHPAQEYALKIVLNSTYGKMAQVIERYVRSHVVDARSEIFDGRVWTRHMDWKDHTSFVYASEITARIRQKCFTDADPSKVIFYATDAVMCTEPLPLKTGPGIGEWGEAEEVTNLVVVGSGVYAYDHEKKGDKEQVVKFRGFAKSMDLRGMLYRANRRHTVRMKVLRNTSLRQSIRNPHELNVLRDAERILNVNFDHKRAWPKRWSARDLLTQHYDSLPLIYYGKTEGSLTDEP